MKYRGFLKIHSQEISNIQKLIDPIVISILFNYLTISSYIKSFYTIELTYFILLLSFLILPKTNLYYSCRNKSLLKITKDVIGAWFLLIALILIIFFTFKISIYFSRAEIILWGLIVLSYLLLHHVGIRKILRFYRARGGNSKTIVFCGSYSEFNKFNKNIEENGWLGLKIIAWFGTKNEDFGKKAESKYKGDIKDIKNYILNNEVDEVVFGTDNGINKIDDILYLLGDTTTPISYFPFWANLNMKFRTEQLGDKYLVRLWGNELNSIDFFFKRLLDLFISLLLTIFLLPFLILIGFAIKINSKGPILFLQLRSGLDGKDFYIYKFRTMTHNIPQNNQVIQATKNDKRVTSVGKILRKYSLDELPQLFNVIKGDMSLVGPRPHAVEHNEYYRKCIKGYMQRHYFKPGMTGLAQINGYRGETKDLKLMEQRIENDLYYINNWNMVLDIKILLKTSYKFSSKKAY